MPRTRQIPDPAIFAIIRGLLASGGPRAVTFAAVAKRSGLSGPSLVQRYGARDAMVLAALTAGWDELDTATGLAIRAAPLSGKGAVALLKALSPDDLALPPSELAVLAADFSSPLLRDRAAQWRHRIIAALAARLGSGDHEGAEILFAAWQGRMLWRAAHSGSVANVAPGAGGFSLRAAQRRLSRA